VPGFVASIVTVDVAADVEPTTSSAPVAPLPTPLLMEPGHEKLPMVKVQPAKALLMNAVVAIFVLLSPSAAVVVVGAPGNAAFEGMLIVHVLVDPVVQPAPVTVI